MITIDSSGVHTQTLEEIQAEQLAALNAINPGIPSGMTGSLQEDMLSTSALLIYEVDQSIAALLGSLNPLYAIDPVVKNIGAALGVPAKLAGKSSAVVTITGNPGVFIPIGFRVKDSGGNTFATTSYSIIPSTGVLSVTMQAVADGDVIVAANTLTTVVSVTTGITSVTNPSPSTEAQNAETMAEYRTRLNAVMQSTQSGVYPAIKAALAAVPNVVTRTIRVIPTGSGIKVLVAGGDDYSIAAAIFANVLDLNGLSLSATDPGRDMTITVVDSNDSYPVKFTRPKSATIGITTTYSTLSSVNQDSFAAAAKQGVIEYVNSLASGAGLNTLKLSEVIASAVADQVPVDNINRMTFAFTVDGTPATPTNNMLELLQDQYAFTAAVNLTFTKV